MKKIIRATLICMLLFWTISTYLCACKKSDAGSSGANSFTFTYNGGTHTTTYDSAVLFSMGPPNFIIANFADGDLPNLRMSLTSMAVGTYPLGSSNWLDCIDHLGFPTQHASSGTVNITGYGNKLVSGNFTAVIHDYGGTIYSTTGTFANVPVSY